MLRGSSAQYSCDEDEMVAEIALFSVVMILVLFIIFVLTHCAKSFSLSLSAADYALLRFRDIVVCIPFELLILLLLLEGNR